MRNVFWLREGVIAGRSGPNRSAWSPADLAEGGIGAVLSVNDGELVHGSDLDAVGIKYRCVPLSDAAPPFPGDLQVCVDALPKGLEFALSSIGSGRSVLVHCSSGKDRTGMFLSYYLCATEGLAPPEAIKEVKRVRSIALSAEGWEKFTLDVLRKLAQERTWPHRSRLTSSCSGP
jgi:protein-tyrosine phosphatase